MYIHIEGAECDWDFFKLMHIGVTSTDKELVKFICLHVSCHDFQQRRYVRVSEIRASPYIFVHTGDTNMKLLRFGQEYTLCPPRMCNIG